MRDPEPQETLVVGGRIAPAAGEHLHHPEEGCPGKESDAGRGADDASSPGTRHRRGRLFLRIHHGGIWDTKLYTVSVPAVYPQAPVSP